MDDDETFNVVVFYDDGYHGYALRWVGAEKAVKTALNLTKTPAAQSGIFTKIIITDSGDNTCFQWEKDKGVTFPTVEERMKFEAEKRGVPE